MHYDCNSWRNVPHRLTTAGFNAVWGNSGSGVYTVGTSAILHTDGSVPVWDCFQEVYLPMVRNP